MQATELRVLTDYGLYIRPEVIDNGVVRFARQYVIACADDERVGYVLYTISEWANDNGPEWAIDADGSLTYQGSAYRAGGLTIDDLEDTQRVANGETWRNVQVVTSFDVELLDDDADGMLDYLPSERIEQLEDHEYEVVLLVHDGQVVVAGGPMDESLDGMTIEVSVLIGDRYEARTATIRAQERAEGVYLAEEVGAVVVSDGCAVEVG
jgi:hypothetical protein